MFQHKAAGAGKRKLLTAVLALIILAAVSAGVTVAYLTLSSPPVENTFSSSAVSCSITESVGGGVKSSVKVQNTGETAAFIRVAVVANTVDGNGNITGPADVSGCLSGAGWARSGKYYYYTQPVAPGALTGELLSSSIDLSGIRVTVLAEAIQSQPAAAAQDAWGVSPASLG